MGFFNNYPYTDFHELNLDAWIAKIKEIELSIKDIYEKLALPEQKWEELQAEIELIYKDIKDINDEIDAIKNGSLLPQYIPAILSAVDEALPELVGRLMRFFIFGLTKDGYFTAMYPDNFNDIMFDTIADPDSDLYGHLVLQF